MRKALSLMQCVESCGHIRILHTSLWRTLVEGPGVGQKGFQYRLINKWEESGDIYQFW